jgi:hypothetical protein
MRHWSRKYGSSPSARQSGHSMDPQRGDLCVLLGMTQSGCLDLVIRSGPRDGPWTVIDASRSKDRVDRSASHLASCVVNLMSGSVRLVRSSRTGNSRYPLAHARRWRHDDSDSPSTGGGLTRYRVDTTRSCWLGRTAPLQELSRVEVTLP